MIRVGIVGLGLMGCMHYCCWKTIPDATITAICEANPKVLAAAGEPSKGNVEGAADHIDLKGVSVHSDLGELLATRSVDALSITLPTFLHPVVDSDICRAAGQHMSGSGYRNIGPTAISSVQGRRSDICLEGRSGEASGETRRPRVEASWLAAGSKGYPSAALAKTCDGR